jgi:hypothetical protein
MPNYWCLYLSKFPSEATYIPSKIWNQIQEFKAIRLLLLYCEVSQHVRKLWADDVKFFQVCCKGESFRDSEAIIRFQVRASGMTMKLSRSATEGILMPTKSLYKHLDKQKFETFEETETCVE